MGCIFLFTNVLVLGGVCAKILFCRNLIVSCAKGIFMKKIVLFLSLIFCFQVFVGSQSMTIISPDKTEKTASGVVPVHVQCFEVEINYKNQAIALVIHNHIATVMTDILYDDYTHILSLSVTENMPK
jgi:hypothetical protein